MAKGLMTSINFGVYPGYCIFAYRYTYDEIIKELKKQDCDEWVAGIEGEKEFLDNGSYFCLHRKINWKGKEKHLYYIIIKKKFDFNDDECYATIAHECVHLCQFYLPRILDRDREHEAEAYLHTHLMNQCMKNIRIAHKKGRKK